MKLTCSAADLSDAELSRALDEAIQRRNNPGPATNVDRVRELIAELRAEADRRLASLFNQFNR